MQVTKQSKIGEVLDSNRETAQFFLKMGMHCLGCAMAHGETLEQACAVHGIDVDALVQQINDVLGE